MPSSARGSAVDVLDHGAATASASAVRVEQRPGAGEAHAGPVEADDGVGAGELSRRTTRNAGCAHISSRWPIHQQGSSSSGPSPDGRVRNAARPGVDEADLLLHASRVQPPCPSGPSSEMASTGEAAAALAGVSQRWRADGSAAAAASARAHRMAAPSGASCQPRCRAELELVPWPEVFAGLGERSRRLRCASAQALAARRRGRRQAARGRSCARSPCAAVSRT